MLSTEPGASSAVRKHQTAVLPPSTPVLDSLPSGDRELLRRRLGEASECVFNAFFQRPEAESAVMAPLPAPPPATGRPRRRARSDDSGVDLLASAPRASLTAEQERHLFLRLNYARYRVMQILRRYHGLPIGPEAIQELLRWERVTQETRNEIVRANLPLVLAMARRTRISNVDQADLISEGNLALLRSVDKFDCARGYKFSTYACRAILKSFARVATRTSRHRGRFPTEFDPTLEKSNYLDQQRRDLEDRCVAELRSILTAAQAGLSEVERQVIRARFAIAESDDSAELAEVRTLEEVGEMIGVTKERVRQIQNKALGKLRTLLEERVLSA
jgi:RNA polymerase primary sigma factor